MQLGHNPSLLRREQQQLGVLRALLEVAPALEDEQRPVGQVMKRTGGRADARVVNEELRRALEG